MIEGGGGGGGGGYYLLIRIRHYIRCTLSWARFGWSSR